MVSPYDLLPEFEVESDEWFKARESGLGASEVAAVLGLSPWQTPLSVYQSKLGVRNQIPAQLAYFGRALEPVIADWVQYECPEFGSMSGGFSARSVAYPWLTASPDRTEFLPTWGKVFAPVELKTSSAYSKDKWADGVPLYYEAQVQTQIAVLDAPYGWLAVLHGGNDAELFKVERDQEFIDGHLIPKTRQFWYDHVVAGVPPEPTTSAEAAELWPGDPELSVEGGEALYELHGAYGLLQAEQIAATEQLDVIKLELQKAMADATELTYQGRTLFTWKPRAGAKRFDANALKADDPALYARYVKQGAPTRPFLRKKVDE